MKQKDLEAWLESAVPMDGTEITALKQAEIEQILGHPGLLSIVGLMLGARMTAYTQLAAISLHDGQQVARASVIQGTIRGIDLLRATLLERGTPADAEEGARA